ncbi:adenylate/guanylate cyclase domain-containing protein [Agrobacterium rosae]|uniref:Adenylate/guanylate cyclase domain-containing protein n=1 Tax=Agrobacterium rosae TaxID=1972867 RepID=A0AAW9FRP2_9HYPH|nr:adenylate/guanylate cyclase domain-containing protein [Agrobacterium rosae]MDX8305530.1 adenylate/guanylate cyclase domain-containing protein [Agrobacterium rosae]
MSDTQRKLTTILCADVQDYSRLMGADEEGTHAILKRSRDTMGRLIELHHGRVVNTWGDGLIAEFTSVVEALRAAIDIQCEMASINVGRPDETQMRLRIGINLGDVIADGQDIYGDGVNIAARLQASAPAGGIVISSTVYEQVHNKVGVGFHFLGQLSVKNIARGVPSYSVRLGTEGEALDAAGRTRKGPREAEEWSGSRADRPTALAGTGTRSFGVIGVLMIAIVVVNLLTWNGAFWASWPLLALAIYAADKKTRTMTQIDRGISRLCIAGAAVVAVNLLSWQGVFWAIWPLLGLATAAGIRWAKSANGTVGR